MSYESQAAMVRQFKKVGAGMILLLIGAASAASLIASFVGAK